MENSFKNYEIVLTIAGSDSSGGAGIQADIKSISACGGYAASIITASTAQNTLGVKDIYPLPTSHIAHQFDAIFSDLQVNAIKIGMLFSKEIIELVISRLKKYDCKNIVLDPVMIATSGDKLIHEESLATLERLMELATLITPNIPEAELLLGNKITTSTIEDSIKELSARYKTSVLLKGGHFNMKDKMLTDYLYVYSQKKLVKITFPRINTQNTHGTGCSLSSSIATYLAKNMTLEQATKAGCDFVHQAILNGVPKVLGKGNGPINHFGL